MVKICYFLFLFPSLKNNFHLTHIYIYIYKFESYILPNFNCGGNTPWQGPKHRERFDTILTIWWRNQIETFSASLALCAGNSPVTDEIPSQRPVMRSFDVFFDLHLDKRLSKQSRCWWFETPLRSLWRHCNESSKNKTSIYYFCNVNLGFQHTHFGLHY